jgi:hypothetical protein
LEGLNSKIIVESFNFTPSCDVSYGISSSKTELAPLEKVTINENGPFLEVTVDTTEIGTHLFYIYGFCSNYPSIFDYSDVIEYKVGDMPDEISMSPVFIGQV